MTKKPIHTCFFWLKTVPVTHSSLACFFLFWRSINSSVFLLLWYSEQQRRNISLMKLDMLVMSQKQLTCSDLLWGFILFCSEFQYAIFLLKTGETFILWERLFHTKWFLQWWMWLGNWSLRLSCRTIPNKSTMSIPAKV